MKGLVALVERIKYMWEHVLKSQGMNTETLQRPSLRRNVASRITNSSISGIIACTKNELQGIINVFGRALESRATTAELLTAVYQLREDITYNLVDLDTVVENE